jgi:hypothetical protein
VFRFSRPARRFSLVVLCVLLTFGCGRESTPTSTPSTLSTRPTDALPSWNEGPAKKSIVDFVARVTREGGPDFGVNYHHNVEWPDGTAAQQVRFVAMLLYPR